MVKKILIVVLTVMFFISLEAMESDYKVLPFTYRVTSEEWKQFQILVEKPSDDPQYNEASKKFAGGFWAFPSRKIEIITALLYESWQKKEKYEINKAQYSQYTGFLVPQLCKEYEKVKQQEWDQRKRPKVIELMEYVRDNLLDAGSMAKSRIDQALENSSQKEDGDNKAREKSSKALTVNKRKAVEKPQNKDAVGLGQGNTEKAIRDRSLVSSLKHWLWSNSIRIGIGTSVIVGLVVLVKFVKR